MERKNTLLYFKKHSNQANCPLRLYKYSKTLAEADYYLF